MCENEHSSFTKEQIISKKGKIVREVLLKIYNDQLEQGSSSPSLEKYRVVFYYARNHGTFDYLFGWRIEAHNYLGALISFADAFLEKQGLNIYENVAERVSIIVDEKVNYMKMSPSNAIFIYIEHEVLQMMENVFDNKIAKNTATVQFNNHFHLYIALIKMIPKVIIPPLHINRRMIKAAKSG